MKATDLMLNDLVLYRGDVAKVIAITANGEVSLLVDGHIVARFVYAEELSPITLTPEILEKNGFVKVIDRFIKDTEEWELCCDKIRITINPFTGYTLAYKEEWLPVLNNLYFKCVHDLQHALKICGIEKEIIL